VGPRREVYGALAGRLTAERRGMLLANRKGMIRWAEGHPGNR
jgi:hypothetical protein